MIVLLLLLQAKAAVPPAPRQIEWAVQAAPEKMRADATVLGYSTDGKPATLRKGTGLLVCLGDDPAQPNHHVSCYHKDLDPFMARGRELRGQGLKDPAIDSVRMAELKSGKIKIPENAALYQYFAPAGSADVATGEIKGGRSMYVVYMPYATPEATGLAATPKGGMPWLMDGGMPWAHIMVTPPQ